MGKRKPFDFDAALKRLADLIPSGHLALASGPEMFLGALEANLREKGREPLPAAPERIRVVVDRTHHAEVEISPVLGVSLDMLTQAFAAALRQRDAAARGSEARSARPSEGGPTPESSPTAAPGGVEARPMKLRAEVDLTTAVYIWEGEDKEDCVLYVHVGSDAAKEIAYRINHFEAGEGSREGSKA